ncbi:Golgi reassembly-stacking protein 2 [Actinomortierella ambigua]|uniref:Golgi reassembly-stacking protein 2 n=1 Tax=Actinomortierella ambigua TaxID=1343610 RepID=A0A9P6PTT7_9FUNG|nr:Golgi reassembly-stacking protein 2 [Actinomortierella ambigua]
MGNAASGEEGRHRLGYHVLRVKEGSPAAIAGIRPYFDYIVGVNGSRLNKESTELQDQMMANEGKTITLDVYSTREQAGRRIEMVPTTQWGDGKGGLLGCSIRFCMFDAANDVVWHVMDVYQGSPAERAGFCAHSDYIVGTPYGIMRGEGDLYDLIEDNAGEALRLYVYNAETDHVREVIIVPNYDWGGEGLLGCDVGYGYLHRLPRGPVGPTSQEGEGHAAALKRSPSLPYPATSQDHAAANEGYARNTLPATFNNPAASDVLLAPTPRPTQPPTWLDPEQQEKLSGMTTPRNTLDFYQGEEDGHAGGETEHAAAGAGVGAGSAAAAAAKRGGQGEPRDPPLLRFGKGNRPDADEDESDEEEFVPRREQPSQQQQQQQQQQSSQQDLASGVAGLTIHGVSSASGGMVTQAVSPPTAAVGESTTTSLQERRNVDLAPLSSPPGSTDRYQHQQQHQKQHQPHQQQHHHPHHSPPHPVMTRFHSRLNPGTTPPPSAAAVESPFSQALSQPSAASQPPEEEEEEEEEINFGDIPFGAGEVPNFASLMSRQQQQQQKEKQARQEQKLKDEKHEQPSPRAHRRELSSLGMGARTMHHHPELETRIPAQTVVAQAQAQSEEYRRAMEQYSQQFQ